MLHPIPFKVFKVYKKYDYISIFKGLNLKMFKKKEGHEGAVALSYNDTLNSVLSIK